MLTFKLFFLFNCVGVMGDQPCGRSHLELANTPEVQFIHRFVESFAVNTCPVRLKLLISLLKFVSQRFGLLFKLIVVEPVLRIAVDVKILHEGVFERRFVFFSLLLHLSVGLDH